MSDTQIWVFGILAFIVLITAVSRLNRHRAPWAVGQPAVTKTLNEISDRQATTNGHLEELRETAATIDDRLTRIEGILKDVE